MTDRLTRFHSSRDQTWRTPETVYRALDEEFGFTLDPCTPESLWDGCAIAWTGHRVFCNPPYCDINRWLEKSDEAELAVYLLPARTGTQWWADHALRAAEIRFIRGRLRFGGASRGSPEWSAPEWSVILVFRGDSK